MEGLLPRMWAYFFGPPSPPETPEEKKIRRIKAHWDAKKEQAVLIAERSVIQGYRPHFTDDVSRLVKIEKRLTELNWDIALLEKDLGLNNHPSV